MSLMEVEPVVTIKTEPIMLTDDEIADFRRLLERQLADNYDAVQAADTGTVTLDQTYVGRLSRMYALQQQAMATGLKDRTLRNEKRLQAALNRIRNGIFGLCCQCGDPITRQRITADPAAPFCADCQDEIEKTRSS